MCLVVGLDREMVPDGRPRVLVANMRIVRS